MSEKTTAGPRFADLGGPLELLRQLRAEHPELPALYVEIFPSSPGRLRLRIHNDLPGFEAWREALGIAPETLRRNLQSGDTVMVLTALGEVAEVPVELTGFAPNTAELHAQAVAA